MTDSPNDTKKTLGTKPLTLKKSPGGTGVVRQQFSHGRSKAVLVEKRGTRKRIGAEPKPKETLQDLIPTVKKPEITVEQALPPAQDEQALGSLSEAERAARLAALNEAKIRDEEEKKRKDQEAREEAERLKKIEEEARLKAEEVAIKAEKGGGDKTKDKTKDEKKPVAARGRDEDSDDEEKSAQLRNANRKKLSIEKPVKKDPSERRQPKLTLQNALDMDDERSVSVAAYRRKIQKEKRKAQALSGEKITREVIIPETISIADLANRMSERAVDVIKFLMKQGAMHKAADVIDADMAQLIAEEMGHTVKRVADSDVEEGLFDQVEKAEDMKPRAPIVTVMGHVDHGKTSLLDALRTTNVVSGEAGGITQHIGAYQVTRENGEKVTFIDTPGHEAFTAMRSRGASITDVVVLVVAADDGVMPQTVEAISHAKSANVPMIVAINKIDKPEADANRVRTELLQYEVVTEAMGGDILEVEVSALKRLGLETLIENIGLQSEILELKANPNRPAEGTVIEARLDKGRGPVATILVQKGTIRQGDIVVAGAAWGKVRALIDDQGEAVQEAGPAMPVEVLGFDSTPDAGDRLAVVTSEARAREIADFRMRKKREKQQALMSGKRGTLTDMLKTLKDQADQKELPVIIKADVQGSVEAIIGALEKIGTDEVRARIIHAGVGGITESDVTLAGASEAVILGFNVRANIQARDAAERDGVNVRYYNIIYDLVNDVKDTLSGLLAPEIREEMLGLAKVLEVFGVSKVGKVAGCLITEGKVERGAGVRLIRDDVVLHEGSLSTLKRFKDDVKEVTSGMECGMSFENYTDLKAGDMIECYRKIEHARSL